MFGVNQDLSIALAFKMEHGRRRPRIVGDPVKALKWIQARKNPDSDRDWFIMFTEIAGMALAAAEAAAANSQDTARPDRENARALSEKIAKAFWEARS
jgi:hypothetical protein